MCPLFLANPNDPNGLHLSISLKLCFVFNGVLIANCCPCHEFPNGNHSLSSSRYDLKGNSFRSNPAYWIQFKKHSLVLHLITWIHVGDVVLDVWGGAEYLPSISRFSLRLFPWVFKGDSGQSAWILGGSRLARGRKFFQTVSRILVVLWKVPSGKLT